MRDSNCSCRDAIWEEGVRHYSEAQLGPQAAPAFLCSCTSSTHTSGCSPCVLPGAVLWLLWDRTGTAHRDLRVRTSCLGTWLEQSCPSMKSATILQPLPSLYMGLCIICVLSQSWQLWTADWTCFGSFRRKAAANTTPFISFCLGRLHATTDEVQPHLTCNTGVHSSCCGRRLEELCQAKPRTVLCPSTSHSTAGVSSPAASLALPAA